MDNYNSIEYQEINLSKDLLSLSEFLAIYFHNKWAKNRIEDGWSYGPERDDVRKLHHCLVPYKELPEWEKDYDRATSQETLKLILSSGFAISKK